MTRNFNYGVAAIRVDCLAQKFLHAAATERSHFGQVVPLLVAEPKINRRRERDALAIRLENSRDEIRCGGFAIRARDADDCDFLRRKTVKNRRADAPD